MSVAGALSFEAAEEHESDQVADLILGVRGQTTTETQLRVLGVDDLDDARRFWRAVCAETGAWRSATLAKRDGEALGVLLTDRSLAIPGRRRRRFLARQIPHLGVRWLRGLRARLGAQAAVTFTFRHCYLVGELHVAAAAQGQGVGSALLLEAERQARLNGSQSVELQVWIGSRALAVYERAGFVVGATLVDEQFESLTGIPGAHRMVKTLA